MFEGPIGGQPVAAMSTMRVLRRIGALVLAAVLTAAAPAQAVTVEQIVALSKSGVSEAVILALLDRDRSVLTIEPEQLVALKRDGLSDTVLMAMLKSGRDEAEDAARTLSAANATAVLSALDTAPTVVVVGHGPDRPNTIHTEDYYRDLRDGVRLPTAVPYGPVYGGYAVPYGAYGTGYARTFRGSRGFEPRAYDSGVLARRDRMLCLAQVNTPAGRSAAYVTECPAIMQQNAPRTR
jgi:hypothetical protein